MYLQKIFERELLIKIQPPPSNILWIYDQFQSYVQKYSSLRWAMFYEVSRHDWVKVSDKRVLFKPCLIVTLSKVSGYLRGAVLWAFMVFSWCISTPGRDLYYLDTRSCLHTQTHAIYGIHSAKFSMWKYLKDIDAYLTYSCLPWDLKSFVWSRIFLKNSFIKKLELTKHLKESCKLNLSSPLAIFLKLSLSEIYHQNSQTFYGWYRHA